MKIRKRKENKYFCDKLLFYRLENLFTDMFKNSSYTPISDLREKREILWTNIVSCGVCSNALISIASFSKTIMFCYSSLGKPCPFN